MALKSWPGLNWTLWLLVLAISLTCGAQAARLAWTEYGMTAADPSYRLQAPETVARIERASLLELKGHPNAAEHELLIAAANDRRFLSAWALANFYSRQRRPDDFWPWAERAVSMSHGERTALYALMLQMGTASQVRERLPYDLHASFGSHLISADRLDDAVAALPASAGELNLTLAERLIADGRLPDALAVWNRSQTPPLDPNHPTLINPAFTASPSGLGFDWRLGTDTSIASSSLVVPAGKGELLSQWVVLEPNRCYRLTTDQEPRDARPGLRWQIDDFTSKSNLLRDARPLDATRNRQTFDFRTTGETRFARLALSSSDSAHGDHVIRRVSLSFAD